MERKKKLRFLQFSLLLIAVIILYFTYYNKETDINKKIILQTKEDQNSKQSTKKGSDEGDVFFNIEYSNCLMIYQTSSPNKISVNQI